MTRDNGYLQIALDHNGWSAISPDGHVHQITRGWANVVDLRERYGLKDRFEPAELRQQFVEQFGKPSV